MSCALHFSVMGSVSVHSCNMIVFLNGRCGFGKKKSKLNYQMAITQTRADIDRLCSQNRSLFRKVKVVGNWLVKEEEGGVG